MSFCSFSSEVIAKNMVSIDNVFITEFLPNASESAVKVYIYGLYKCQSGKDNTLEDFSKSLNMQKEDIVSIFYYWQEKGLVQVIAIEPIEIRYLPVSSALQKIKKYNVDKYSAFNISAQELIGTKMLTPRELEEFYYLIENLNMEKEAVLKIIDYCVKQKGKSASVNYITTIAKNWAYDNVKTSADVDNRLIEQERISGDVVLVLKAMGLKRMASDDEYKMYRTWINELEFPLSIIIHIAKISKCKNFNKLDELIMKCYSQKLESEKEIDDYFASLENLFKLAKMVVKNMGLYYSDLTAIVDEYITTWIQMGYDEESLLKLSNYAFKTSIRTLEGLNHHINNLFKKGVITSGDIDNYMEEIVSNDNNICQILCNIGISRKVNSQDRNLYKVWSIDWGIPFEVILYASTICADKYMPLQYLGRLLSEYKAKGVKTIEEAKIIKLSTPIKTIASSKKEAKKHEYTKKELDSLFDNIYEVEI